MRYEWEVLGLYKRKENCCRGQFGKGIVEDIAWEGALGAGPGPSEFKEQQTSGYMRLSGER